MTAVHKPLDQVEKELIVEHGGDSLPLETSEAPSSWFSWLFKPQQPRFTKLADIVYPSLSGIQSEKNKLDVYIPKQASTITAEAPKPPVLIHIHGGGWVRGDKSTHFYGSPSTGTSFASFNFVTVCVGYRVGVPFPGAIQDVSDAIAWVYNHIGEKEYGGGDLNRVFISGHSAGGHLASLVTLDRQWLDRRAVPADFIKGVVSISGIYNVPDPLQNAVALWGYNKLYITPTFGDNMDFMLASSPLTHIRRLDATQPHSTPPFLIVNAGTDFGLEKDGVLFSSVFIGKNLPCRYELIADESHASISRSERTMELARDFLVSLIAILNTQPPAPQV